MPEPSDHSLARRGAWIGLRTLRQRPKLVDHTESGEPIFEVRSVRLLLRADADHFNRVERCSKCGRLVPGAPVHELADLDRPANPLICTSCVRAVAKQTTLRPMARRTEQDAAPPGTDPDAADTAVPAVEGGAGPEPGPEAGPGVAEAAAVDDGLRRDLAAVTELLQAQHQELAALSAALAATQTELRTVVESGGILGAAQQELHRRLDEMAALIEQRAEDAGRASLLERRIEAVADGLAGELAQARTEAADGVARLVERIAGIEQAVEAHRTEVQSAFDEQVRAQLGDAARAVGELRRSSTALDGRLGALERGLEQMGDRLTALVDAQWAPPPLPGDRTVPPAAGPRGERDLLGALERQLQEADGRLSRLSVVARRTELDPDPDHPEGERIANGDDRESTGPVR